MNKEIKVTINVIIHSTEDVSKIVQSLSDVLEVESDYMTTKQTTGYFGNTIVMLDCNLLKKQAKRFVKTLIELFTSDEIEQLIHQIPQRVEDSRFHMRLDKQKLVQGKAIISDDGGIKIGIKVISYSKNDNMTSIFSEILNK